MESQREVGGREDGQALDEDVGDGLIFGEVRVELVSAKHAERLVFSLSSRLCNYIVGKCHSDRANKMLQGSEGFILHTHSGNRKR